MAEVSRSVHTPTRAELEAAAKEAIEFSIHLSAKTVDYGKIDYELPMREIIDEVFSTVTGSSTGWIFRLLLTMPREDKP